MPEPGLTSAMEDYLKTIYKLQAGQQRVTTSAVAEAMEVKPASATNMLKRLAELNLVEHEPYRGVSLTHDGRRAALEIVRHHRLIELFLQHALGYQWDEVDAEAERLEHAITQEFADRIEKALGHPTHDPHGHPIPNRDLEIGDQPRTRRLSEVVTPRRVQIRVVDDSDPARLRYLAEIGLVPGAFVDITVIGPFNGPLTVQVGGREQVVGHELASHVLIDAD